MQNQDITALYQRARSRTDAAGVIDGAHTVFIARIGVLDSLVSDGTKAPAAAAAERAHLVERHRTMLLTIADAPEQQLHGLLFPHMPTPAASRAAQAIEAVAQARAAGVVLTSPAAGVIEAAPREKLTGPLSDMIADLRSEISAHLRASVETFAPAT